MPTHPDRKIDIKKYLAAIAEPNRFAILHLLKQGEKCACEIHPELHLAQNLSSHHLKVLKDAGVVKSRRRGTQVLYSRDDEAIRRYQSAVNEEII